MGRLVLALLVAAALAAPARATYPIERRGPSCPLGFYTQGAYCVPSGGYRQDAIPRYGDSCPLGWYRTGNYCTRNTY